MEILNASINYHNNVFNAFRTAEAFTRAVAGLPGSRKYIIAHSLGNVLVSAARQDYGLQYERYFMLNAAVPVEAYDPVGGITPKSKECMTPPDWRPYADFLRSTHWHELFAEGDARRRLTWKGRFKDVNRAVNFFSSKDEVVANGDGSDKALTSRKYAWYNQERKKGERLVSMTPEAGWKFNIDNYSVTTIVGHNHGDPVYGPRRYTQQEAAQISPINLMTRPFFRDFRESAIYGPSGDSFLEENTNYFHRVLSYGVSVESFAVGANPVSAWEIGETDEGVSRKVQTRNIDMAIECMIDKNDVWIHSYFIQKSLHDTHLLYNKMIKLIETESEGEDQ